jgi:hypothetical protein
MTLPHEEVATLKRAHRFLSNLMVRVRYKRFLLGLLCSRAKREEFVSDIYRCVKHFPFDIHIDTRWGDSVCPKCEDTIDFCKCKKEDRER